MSLIQCKICNEKPVQNAYPSLMRPMWDKHKIMLLHFCKECQDTIIKKYM